MKLLWLSPYPVQRLGAELEFSRQVRKGGHSCSWIVNLLPEIQKQFRGEIHLLTVSPLVKKDQVVRKGGVIYHVLKSGIPFCHRGCPSWLPLDALCGFYLLRLKIKKEIRRIDPDVIHAHGTEGVYGLVGATQKQAPCLISIQGVINELVKVTPTVRFRIMAFWEGVAVRCAKYLACRTHYDKRFVKEKNPSAKIYELHEAINRRFFSDTQCFSGQPNVLFVGTLVPWKGVDILLKAMSIVSKQTKDALLIIVGGGPTCEVSRLKKLASELRVERSVKFVGVQSPEEIRALHRQSRVFVLPSRNDNSPNSLVEAMAAGMPVVAADVGGVASMFHNGESGMLVATEDPDALGRAILHLLDEPAECERLGKNAAELAQFRNNPARVARQTIDAYFDMLKRESAVDRD